MDRLLMSGIAPFHVPIDHFSAKALTLFNVFIATPPRVYSLLTYSCRPGSRTMIIGVTLY